MEGRDTRLLGAGSKYPLIHHRKKRAYVQHVNRHRRAHLMLDITHRQVPYGNGKYEAWEKTEYDIHQFDPGYEGYNNFNTESLSGATSLNMAPKKNFETKYRNSINYNSTEESEKPQEARSKNSKKTKKTYPLKHKLTTSKMNFSRKNEMSDSSQETDTEENIMLKNLNDRRKWLTTRNSEIIKKYSEA
ncbi:hypothetical protein SNEBB_002984 [Seison nebaliae]|nr:hypothetical protein SNEBB_002984 [Seison nebaliae]